MSIRFLQTLRQLPRPSTLTDPSQINELIALRGAGYVAAWIKRPNAENETAVFLAITPSGQEALLSAEKWHMGN